MFANTNILDCLFAQRAATIIGLRYTNAVAAELLAAAVVGPGTVTLSAGGDVATFPQITVASRDGTVVVWIAGTTEYEQLALQALYFATPPVDLGLFSCNALYGTAALNIGSFLTGSGLGGATRFVLVGHSYGGAVASVLAARIRLANPTKKIELLTFGCPKPGDDRLQDILESVTNQHYANVGDPVPFLPPVGTVLGLLFGAAGALLALQWAQFVGPLSMKVVAEDGKVTDFDPNNMPLDLITVAGVAIIAAVSAPTFRDHNVFWYAYYLCLGCGCVPKPCTPVPPAPLNLRLQLRNYSYKFGGANFTNSIVAGSVEPTLAEIVGHAPNGLPSAWKVEDPSGAFILVVATFTVGGDYSAFRFQLEPFPVDPIFLTYWDFTAAQVLAGVNLVNPAPTFFQPKIPGDQWNFVFELVCLPVIM